GLRRGQRGVGHHRGQPAGHVRAAGRQPAAQRAVQFGGTAGQRQAIGRRGHVAPGRQLGFAHGNSRKKWEVSVTTTLPRLLPPRSRAYTRRMGDRVVPAKQGLACGVLLASLPAFAAEGDASSGHLLVLPLSMLVLLLAWLAIASHRRRAREQRRHLDAQRESEQQLRLSLWASNELYWQYDLRRREMEITRVAPDGGD